LDLLLDTHALIWWLAGDDRLSPPAKAAVMDESQKVFVSAASLWCRFRRIPPGHSDLMPPTIPT
jgi:PIN domain nuclease of toxin-antitoxin system